MSLQTPLDHGVIDPPAVNIPGDLSQGFRAVQVFQYILQSFEGVRGVYTGFSVMLV